MLRKDHLRDFDWLLFAAVLGLAAIGIAFIWSATYDYNPHGRSHGRGYARAQTRSAVIGLAAFVVVLLFDYMLFHRYAWVLYGIGMTLLLYVHWFGSTRGGATRWIRLPGYNLQPSELMKIAVILALGRYLIFRRNYRQMKGLPMPFLLVLAPMLLIMRQPDLGTACVLLPVMFVMLYIAGARPRHLGLAVAGGMGAAVAMWFTVMSDRQKDRIIGFLAPEAHRSGAGYHALQSLGAIAGGGVTGKGFAMGSQHLLDRLPAAHTDFIYAVICEEWGFIGGGLVLLLWAVVFWRGIAIAARTREPFGRLLVIGGLTVFGFQVAVNLGMTMRLCPITGLTLPFVSYGGSSLLSSFIILGLITSVGMRRKTVVAPDDFA